MCQLFVGLPAVNVRGMFGPAGEPIRVHVETVGERPCCPTCGALCLREGPQRR